MRNIYSDIRKVDNLIIASCVFNVLTACLLIFQDELAALIVQWLQ